ncbi:MAG TPA: IS110 family transposase [Methanospirillum sp.]|uniref:IS110 family transposase n=1 Tax=Methanospirillum sp. TaxID=45200 RepID=UPI002CC2272D|nr:IS110 family transposase [Methanospirillum sp.]HWQ63985.1 IS110 family transposase [Methanospirillum sp.]
MTEQIQVAAGLDLHKSFIVATILTLTGDKLVNRFDRTQSGLIALKNWIISYNVEAVGCESTSDYWVRIFDLLNPICKVIVGNARDMKALSHKKTDKIDSEFIALITLKDMIHPSRIFPKEHREFRSTIRLRHKLVQKRSSIKNEIHHILDSELFRLSSVLTDIFGKSGALIMKGILNDMQVDEILSLLPSSVLKKEEVLREVLTTTLSEGALTRLASCLRLIKTLNQEITELTYISTNYALINFPREYEILKSVPGIGDITTVTLLAEIGDVKDFSSGDKLASWLGIVPRVYQSADKLYTGSITKRGSRVARWILIQAAHAAVKARDNDLKTFYLGKKDVIGNGKAIVSVARKMVIIIWHLLVNDEIYKDNQYRIVKPTKKVYVKVPRKTSIEEVLKILREAAVILQEPDPENG